jgi:hypothetical protein
MDEAQAMRIFRTFNAGAEVFRAESERHENTSNSNSVGDSDNSSTSGSQRPGQAEEVVP